VKREELRKSFTRRGSRALGTEERGGSGEDLIIQFPQQGAGAREGRGEKKWKKEREKAVQRDGRGFRP